MINLSQKIENIPTMPKIYGLVATDILLIFYAYFLHIKHPISDLPLKP